MAGFQIDMYYDKLIINEGQQYEKRNNKTGRQRTEAGHGWKQQSGVLLTGTTGFMVKGKYLGKKKEDQVSLCPIPTIVPTGCSRYWD